MQNLLPRVREGTYDSVAHSLDENYKSDKELIMKSLEHIKKVNPQIHKFIIYWSNKLDGKEFIHELVGFCALYRLLESEAEATIFEQEMKESNSRG